MNYLTSSPKKLLRLQSRLFIAALLFFISIAPLQVHANPINGIANLAKGNYTLAINILVPEAKKGNVIAQIYVSWMYEKGLGTKKNKKQALLWLSAAMLNSEFYQTQALLSRTFARQ
jgi:TPR repeat protein